jgi:CBS domain containing-hemolysin-like protein
MGEWILLAAAVLLTVGTGVFVAMEFSLVALDRPAVQRAIDEGDTGAQSVMTSLRRLSTQLSAAQVGITLTTLVVGYLAQPSLGSLLTGAFRPFVPDGALDAVAAGAALVLFTVFSMIIGELLPQFLGISAPLPVAKVVAGPVRVFSIIAKPLISALNGSANGFLRGIGIEPQEELSGARTPQELASLVRRSAEVGTLEESTALIINRSLDFAERTAVDVMTPRVRASAVSRTASAADVVRLTRHTGHSRFPVLGDDWDDIDGVVHVKQAVAVPWKRREAVPVSALMTPHVAVPETMRLATLLGELRTSGLQFAVVLDEHGGTSGVVTLEDVIEELVGEVRDEHDASRMPAHQLADGSWSVPGIWRPDEVTARLGAPVPEGAAYETLGGFVMAALGRVPAEGDHLEIPGWRLRVLRMDGRRVARVRFEVRS